jgi:ABC-type transport system involved in cytochrome c biogenesis permease subunit
MIKPEEADAWPVFRIDNSELKSLLALPDVPNPKAHLDGKHFSWNQFAPKLADLKREAARATKLEKENKSQMRPYDHAVLNFWNAQTTYARLREALEPVAAPDMEEATKKFMEKVETGRTAYLAMLDDKEYDEPALEWLKEHIETPLIVPTQNLQKPKEGWKRVTESLMESARSGGDFHYAILAYHKMANAYRAGKSADFNAAVANYQSILDQSFPKQTAKTRHEQFFNFFEPFYKAMIMYVAAFIMILVYWMKPLEWEWLRDAAFKLVLLTLVVHTFGLLFRMFLEGRPPVTNLYSSAIFIGWGATILGLVLELFWKNSIGLVVSSAIGFLTLIIAHHLSLTGDTLIMLRAVLDTNFWLATHVVVVTLGYASTFVAGFLGIIYIVRGVFSSALDAPLRKSLTRMIYGILCFSTLFSFVGTVLGGIWADQSWGRFWGWDPKENGALIIVLWNALVLHARWGGLVRERGLANMAVVGNIVTSWSWFGVNMLEIGLHSYGFTEGTFHLLLAFVVSQLGLIGLGLLPLHMWRSFSSVPVPAPAFEASETAR